MRSNTRQATHYVVLNAGAMLNMMLTTSWQPVIVVSFGALMQSKS